MHGANEKSYLNVPAGHAAQNGPLYPPKHLPELMIPYWPEPGCKMFVYVLLGSLPGRPPFKL